MGLLSSITSGLSALVQLGLGLFRAKNTAPVVQSAEAAKDEQVLGKAGADTASGDIAELGKDISQ